MNPLCNYFGYLFLNYCLIEKSVPSEEVSKISARRSTNNIFEVEYQWRFINFTWPSTHSYQTALSRRHYIPENVAMTGIKYYKGDIYIAMPQIRRGVPATLGVISADTSDKTNILIQPFPSWDMNVKGKDCTSLQSVQSMEIDRDGIMWVLDGFRINTNTRCPPKLVLLDLNNYGKVVLSYIFPKEIALSQGGYLNDIVVDETNEGFAFITDNSPIDPGLIVYSRRQNRAWKLRDKTMFPEDNIQEFTVANATFRQLSPIDGIALSPIHTKSKNKILYYSSLTGLNLYSIKTKLLKNENLINTGDWRRGIKLIGTKQGPSDGLMVDSVGNLFYTLPSLNGVGKWNINSPFSTAEIITQDSQMVWPDSFTFDDKGNLRLLTNSINKFMDISYQLQITAEFQFKIFKYFTGTKSYLN